MMTLRIHEDTTSLQLGYSFVRVSIRESECSFPGVGGPSVFVLSSLVNE